MLELADGLGPDDLVICLMALGLALDEAAGVHAIAGGTDGVDGAEEIAGALLVPDSLARAPALGVEAADALANNDAHTVFTALGDSVVTGPTLTDVDDFRTVRIDPR